MEPAVSGVEFAAAPGTANPARVTSGQSGASEQNQPGSVIGCPWQRTPAASRALRTRNRATFINASPGYGGESWFTFPSGSGITVSARIPETPVSQPVRV